MSEIDKLQDVDSSTKVIPNNITADNQKSAGEKRENPIPITLSEDKFNLSSNNNVVTSSEKASFEDKLTIRNNTGMANPAQVNPYERPISNISTLTDNNLMKEIDNIRQLLQNRVIIPLNTAQTEIKTVITNFVSGLIDVTGKIAAALGEREKDLRERISDTFKTIEAKIYNPFEKIDASMDQKDHQKEKKTRDPEKNRLNRLNKGFKQPVNH